MEGDAVNENREIYLTKSYVITVTWNIYSAHEEVKRRGEKKRKEKRKGDEMRGEKSRNNKVNYKNIKEKAK
jgi:hypothetical protein